MWPTHSAALGKQIRLSSLTCRSHKVAQSILRNYLLFRLAL